MESRSHQVFKWHQTGGTRWQPESRAVNQSKLDSMEGWAEKKLMEFSSPQSPVPGKAVFGNNPVWACLAGQLYRKGAGAWGHQTEGAHSGLAALRAASWTGAWSADKGGDYPLSSQHSVYHIQILCPVWGFSYRKDWKLNWVQWKTITKMLRARALAMWGGDEEIEVAKFGEETALGGCHGSLQYLRWGYWEAGVLHRRAGWEEHNLNMRGADRI